MSNFTDSLLREGVIVLQWLLCMHEFFCSKVNRRDQIPDINPWRETRQVNRPDGHRQSCISSSTIWLSLKMVPFYECNSSTKLCNDLEKKRYVLFINLITPWHLVDAISPINFKLDLVAEISYVIEWPSLYMKHIGHHHSFPTMMNDCVQHSSMYPTITNLDLYSFGVFCARLC